MRLLILLGIPTLTYVAMMLWDPSQTGLVIWPRDGQVSLGRLIPFAAALVLYLGFGHVVFERVGDTTSKREIAALLAAVFMAGGALQVAATSVPETYPLRGILHRHYSQFTGGYFSVGARVDDVGDFLARYAELMPGFPVHPQHHPPGLSLLFTAGAKLAALMPGISSAIAPELRPLACFDERAASLNDAQIVGGLIGAGAELAVATLVIVPLFVLVRRLSNQRAAILAAVIYPLTACVLMWVGRFDHLYPFFAVCGLLLCEQIISSPKRAGLYALALGAMLGLATFLTYGNLQIVLVCAVYFVARAVQKERFASWKLRLGQGLLMAAAFAAFWLAWAAAFRFDLLATYQYATGQHFTLDRPYWPWVVWQPWDIFTFIGLPISIIALAALWKRQPALALAFAGPILFMCLLHIMRDETGRTGMYFAPLAVALAAMYLADATAKSRAVVLGLLVVQVFVMVSLFRVTSYGADPLTVNDAVLPADMIETDIRYEENGELRLLGYTMKDALKPGEDSSLTLFWRLDSAAPISTSYKIFFHLADTLEDQSRVVNQDGKPLNWALPTTCWLPGQVLQDVHAFRVDPNAQPGNYLALVGLYDERDGRRARVFKAQIAKNGAVQLPAPVRVE